MDLIETKLEPEKEDRNIGNKLVNIRADIFRLYLASDKSADY